ncbi:hypothetical protein GWK47_012519 [Chionoecetes opilio]|uniref:Uncharacterized protein n=1 Tax=Chionoecetes opilio TaxID=41210 RepID=A0A8J4XUR8_CHIOP|nr:hypothetical protein GWK47_012519 [Chionoecetes opilio]
MLGSLRRKKKSKKEAASEAAAPRSFTDPARQIFHELRAGVQGGGLRGLASSLQGSPRSPRRHPPGGTAPPSLQSSPVPARRDAPSQQQEATPAVLVTPAGFVAPAAPAASLPPASGSPCLTRRRHLSQEHLRPSPRGSPVMGRRAVRVKGGEARVGGLRDREGKDAEGLSQPGTKHLPVSRFRSSAAADLRVPVRGPSATHLGLLTFSFDLFPRASCDPRDLRSSTLSCHPAGRRPAAERLSGARRGKKQPGDQPASQHIVRRLIKNKTVVTRKSGIGHTPPPGVYRLTQMAAGPRPLPRSSQTAAPSFTLPALRTWLLCRSEDYYGRGWK